MSLRQPDVQFPANLLQLGQVDPPIHHGLAGGTDAHQVPQGGGHGFVVDHVAVRIPGVTAAHAVDLTRLASPLVFQPSRLKKRGEITAEDEHGPLPVTCRQPPPLDPLAHGVPVNAEELGDLLNGVAAVNLDESVIRVAPCHETPSTPCRLDSGGEGLPHGLALRLAWIRRCSQSCTSASSQPTARPPRLTGRGNVPCAIRR